MTFDIDQSAFTTLSLASKQKGVFDEIRFATTFEEALGREPPAASGSTIWIR
jgi:hypothetical protein